MSSPTASWFVYGSLLLVLYKAVSFIWTFMGFRNWFADQACPSPARIDGKVVLITGGNGGIGAETAKELVSRGASVYLACRNVESAEIVCRAIVDDFRHDSGIASRLHVLSLDLSSFASVRACATRFRVLSDRLDILVNNAGVMMCPFQRSVDGVELQMATNHLGHFLLTNLLLDLLVSSAPSRVINVSSVAHWWASGNFDDLSYQHSRYDSTLSYAQSKLANILFTSELDRRLRVTSAGEREPAVTVNALHPGVVDTPLFRHVWLVANPVCELFLRPIRYLMEKTPRLGAQTSIFLSVSPEMEGVSGKYFSDCRVARVSTNAADEELAKKLWKISEKLVGLDDDEGGKEVVDGVTDAAEERKKDA